MSGAVPVGVLGLRRGAALARLAGDAGMRLVAVCERDDRRRDRAAAALDVAAYRDLEHFLDHAMDAVILVNDFDQHAPVAIQALERGLSVLSETAACRTLAEGVALVEAAERSPGVYMFAENYPSMPFTREMRRRYAAGDIGPTAAGPEALERARRGRGWAALLRDLNAARNLADLARGFGNGWLSSGLPWGGGTVLPGGFSRLTS